MRVVFNQLSTLRAKTGVGEYTYRLMEALRGRGVSVEGIPSGLLAQLFRLGGAVDHGRATPTAPHGRKEPWHHPRVWLRHLKTLGRKEFQKQSRRALNACDLYHEPNFLALEADAPTIVTVHDLSVLRMPEYHPAERVRAYERDFQRSLNQAAHVITVSKSIRKEVIDLLGHPAHKVTAALNGVRSDLRELSASDVAPRLRKLGLPKQFLLYLGTLEPRKNVLQLMQAFCSLPQPVRERCPLVLAGGWGWNYKEIADYYEAHARHSQVMHLGYVPAADLIYLYNGARALVSPSYYEGFGLPPAEMLACGGAVIASRIDAAMEVVGAKAHLVDADDRDGWRRAMARVILEDDWRQELRRGAAESVAALTWDACAQSTLAVYRQVLQAPAALPERKAS